MPRFRLVAVLLALSLALPLPGLAATTDPLVSVWQAQPGNDGLAIALARQAAKAGDWARATEVLTVCVQTPGEHRPAWSELGWMHYLAERRPEAVAALRRAVAPPADPLALGRLAWVLAETADRSGAIEAALAARRLTQPEGKPLALLTLGRLTDDDGRARQYFAEASTLSASPWPSFWLARRLEAPASFHALASAWRLALASDDPFERAAADAARIGVAMEVERHPELSGDYLKLLEGLAVAHPQDEALSDRLVQAYGQNDQPELAIAELRRRLGLAADKAAIAQRIAGIYVALGQDALALGTTELALKLTDPKSATGLKLRSERASFLLGLGREAEAMTELDAVLKDAPDYRRAKLLKGLAHALKREWPKAAQAVATLEPATAEERLLINFIRRQDGKPARWLQIFPGGV